jgi:hypothetical protein
MLLLSLCLVLAGSILASQNSQVQKSEAKPLNNSDVLDMLNAGISQDVVIAKIKKTMCDFDTSASALKTLKAAQVSDAVLLAMVEASGGSANPKQASTVSDRLVDTTEVAIPARVNCNHSDPVPVFSAPRDQSNSVEAFTVRCGDRTTIIEPIKKASWVKIRNLDGRVGYISWVVLSMQASEESEKQAVSSDTEKQSATRRREEVQKASDDLEDCRTRVQNEYDTKMSIVSTLAVPPLQRVYASSRLKQNLDAENKNCRLQYESRMKAIEGQ